MLKLPPNDHPAREAMGDMAEFARYAHPDNRAEMLTLRDALIRGRRYMRETTDKAVRRVFYICQRNADGAIILVSIGRREGWRVEWNFGKG